MVSFDKVINRLQTDSEKWDGIAEKYQRNDLLPMWVADMDFPSPQVAIDAMQEILSSQPVLGYTSPAPSLYDAIINWESKRHQVQLSQADILFSPGVVPSISTVIQALTQEEEIVMIHDPVYHPFKNMVKSNGRKLLTSPLLVQNGHFEMNFSAIEEAFKTQKVALFILSNPQNPGGRVWTKAELVQLADLCITYQVYLISDEIHGDLVFAPHAFTSMLSISGKYNEHLIVLTAATKAFNLAGVKNSMIYVKNEELREKIVAEQARSVQQEINTFGLVATEAVYRHGEAWLEQLLDYLKENIAYAAAFFEKELPELTVMQPEGTYLIWLDCRKYESNDAALEKRLIEKGKLIVNMGIMFGSGGSGHIRMNIACPRATLIDGLNRLKTALQA